jgi:prolipoprotein diacylglyceryltransferase
MMAVGRLGCYAAHCCVGVESSAAWARDFGDGVPRLPIQLVEAALLFVLLAGLQLLHAAGRLPDRRLFVFFAAYGSVRFALELWREPVATVSVGIGFYQWLALLLAGVGLWQIAKRTRLQEAA